MTVGLHSGGRPGGTRMANKDKGGKSSKTAATKNLKEKRLAKKAKKTDGGRTGAQSVDRAFGH